MRVFVTGATGHIGSLVVAELLTAGHEVVGLARSDKSAAALTAAGAQVHAAGATDLRAVETIGEVLVGTDSPFVVTSGTAGVKPGHVLTEDDPHGGDSPRGPSENTAIALAERGVRSSVVRLAPSVHGPADHHGFISTLINVAREKGVSAYVGDGANRWPAVPRLLTQRGGFFVPSSLAVRPDVNYGVPLFVNV